MAKRNQGLFSYLKQTFGMDESSKSEQFRIDVQNEKTHIVYQTNVCFWCG